jgi:hypothetical protein
MLSSALPWPRQRKALLSLLAGYPFIFGNNSGEGAVKVDNVQFAL